MIILGIETSCDETALSLIEATGGIDAPKFRLIGSSLFSQAHLHAEFGGVFPNLARREHQKNLLPLFQKLLAESGYEKKESFPFDAENMERILEREPELLKAFSGYLPTISRPAIDAIAVTSGPGLEPALWVGISFAQALGKHWNMPVIATNHMEGHIVSPILASTEPVEFPALALLISGGHTELIEVRSWREMRMLGATRDDAVGEAFDKAARILGLPYPGGPEISRLAERKRARGGKSEFKLPRPMISSSDYDFSFAGLKTAVLYAVRDAEKTAPLTEDQKEELACEFEDAATEVLTAKTRKALEETCAKSLIIGGGVISNTHIRQAFSEMVGTEFPETKLLIPSKDLATDNAVMIAMAAYIDIESGAARKKLAAEGNLKVGR